ncbi:rps2 [Ecytonucleospora hepatopenaei]|uniref:Small ribosomal subunit protein uS5 n=1 Tax=Ecytonucleospora hepatopenaei TaxID=646526 RepID=A0A1W0E554_9MICR|nr:rps2 [Ecytonucleospora hepatopenaei]
MDNKSSRPRDARRDLWTPKTRLGLLVKNGHIKTIDEIFKHSLRIQEPEIVDHLLGKGNLKEEILSIKSVQKQSKAGQKTSMKVVVAVGNSNGYIGLGTHSAREMSTSIKGAIAKAKMNLFPVRMGQWEGTGTNKHTVAVKASGKCGSVSVKLVPAPIGTGINWSNVARMIFELAGIKDIYIKSFGCSKTTENYAKAILMALETSSSLFIPSQWADSKKSENPLVKFSDVIHQLEKKSLVN